MCLLSCCLVYGILFLMCISVMGVTPEPSADSALRRCFNPRTRDGRDELEQLCLVSIHAPVVGATCACRAQACESKVSIRAPVMGTTKWSVLCHSRPRVSIHAPVMGAT